MMKGDPAYELEVLRYFGFEVRDVPESIWPTSTVYRCTNLDGTFVVKDCRRAVHKSRRVARWLEALVERGVDVVAPADLPGRDNPRAFAPDDVRVVYPFVEGRPYRGRPDLEGAGRLLGAIHRAHEDGIRRLPRYRLIGLTDEIIDTKISELSRRFERHAISSDLDMLRATMHEARREGFDLRSGGIRWVNGIWDFKATNLIFRDDAGPVLIDPDFGLYLPRLVDLAISLLRFHTELAMQHAAVFTPDEWAAFLAGYRERVTLEPDERASWPLALRRVFAEQGLHALKAQHVRTEAGARMTASLLALPARFDDYPIG